MGPMSGCMKARPVRHRNWREKNVDLRRTYKFAIHRYTTHLTATPTRVSYVNVHSDDTTSPSFRDNLYQYMRYIHIMWVLMRRALKGIVTTAAIIGVSGRELRGLAFEGLA
eukprot:1391905-Amorphochlora_amoeboformis.AAC.1